MVKGIILNNSLGGSFGKCFWNLFSIPHNRKKKLKNVFDNRAPYLQKLFLVFLNRYFW